MKNRRNILYDGKRFGWNEKNQTLKLNLWLEKRKKTKLSTVLANDMISIKGTSKLHKKLQIVRKVEKKIKKYI